jgi:hypothetical protein
MTNKVSALQVPPRHGGRLGVAPVLRSAAERRVPSSGRRSGSGSRLQIGARLSSLLSRCSRCPGERTSRAAASSARVTRKRTSGPRSPIVW